MSWSLPTASAVYVVTLAPDRLGPVLEHWGPAGSQRTWQLPVHAHFETLADVTPLEYTALGTRHVRGVDLVVDHGTGLVGARLVWDEEVEHRDDGQHARFTACATDTTGRLGVALHIETSRAHDVVRKWVVLRNLSDQVLDLPRAFGPAWELLVGPGARVDTLSGHWTREFEPATVDLPVGELRLGSRQGVTSHTYSPVITVSARSAPAMADGGAYGIALAWCGSWQLSVDAVPLRERVRVASGVDDESCVVTLLPGESFTSPETLGVFAADGSAGVAVRWHEYERTVLARSLDAYHHPVVYNSWYATQFAVEQSHQRRLAAAARELGAEVFVVDDGWFAGRSSDRAALGDWTADPVKFPHGLESLADDVLALGMRLGLWIEPEGVSPDSDLFRAHPDWVYRAGDRPLVTVRHQHVLDLGRPEVLDWIENTLRRLLADGRITYLKWDMNRPVSDGGRPGDPHGRQWSVQHAQGYLRVMRMLRAEFPHVTVEACASGGGRVDLAVLAVSDVVWPSDETGPRDRLAIQHGFLSAYPPHAMSSWITDAPDLLDRETVSFEFRFVVAMAGVLGVGSDVLAWTPAHRERAAALVALYRDLRPLIHSGRVERHGTPADPVYAVEYGGGDQDDRTCLLVYARGERPQRVWLRPRTLTVGRRYRRVGSAEEFAGGGEVEIPFAVSADADVVVIEPVP